MKKGIVATLDFVFAAVIILLIITAFTFSQKHEYPGIAHVRIANDIYNILDSKNLLSFSDSNATRSQLINLLPDNLDASINITCFNYCSDIGRDCSQEFYLNKTIFIPGFSTTSNIVSYVQRFFYAEPLYCEASVGVWTR